MKFYAKISYWDVLSAFYTRRLVAHVVRHACFLGDALAAQPRQPALISIKAPERARFRRDFRVLVGIQHTGD